MSESPAIESKKPRPLPDALSAPFWESAARHVLSIQYCEPCSLYIHPPAQCCPQCDSFEPGVRPVSGRGTLYSYTVVNDVPTRGFEDEVPYVCGVVELVEQPRLIILTNIRDAGPGELRIGMTLEVVFEDLAPDCAIPQFRPARGQ